MKTYTTLIFLTLFSLISKSQQYSFPLYFEDSAGKRDTLYFGFDESATFGVDEKLGEHNIIRQPYDSTFFPFFTDAATANEYCRLDNEKTPSYVLKKQYINMMNNSFAEIGTIAKNWPIKISWNKTDFQDFNIAQYLGIGMQLVITNFHPFNGYPDFPCCYRSFGLNVLSDTSEISIAKNSSCEYITNYSRDSISLIYIGYMYKYTSVKDFQINKFQCWYNEKLESVSIQNMNGVLPFKLEIYNTLGIKVMDKQVFGNNKTLINLNINYLPYGLYIVRLYELKNASLTFTFKIIKR